MSNTVELNNGPKHFALTGTFSGDRQLIKTKLESMGHFVHGSIRQGTHYVVVGEKSAHVLTNNIQLAQQLEVPVIHEKALVSTLYPTPPASPSGRCVQVSIQLPGAIRNVKCTGTLVYDWNVGDKCWVSNEAGQAISDEAFEFIGDDLELTILSIYDAVDGTKMAVVERGAHHCFRLDMLRPIKSKRDKAIDAVKHLLVGGVSAGIDIEYLATRIVDEVLKDE